MAAGPFLSLVLLVWFFSGFVELHASVPVLIWSKESLPGESNPILAGHTITAGDFRQNYLDKILSTSTTICLFIQDTLSIDDITRYGNAYSPGSHSSVFNHLRTAVESANSSVVLPAVTSPTSGLVDHIKTSASGKVVELFTTDAKSIKSIGNQGLDSRKTNVFIVHLQPLAESSIHSVADVLAANDLVIGQVLQELNSLGTPYTCILTADSPSKNVEKKQLEAEMSSVARDRLRRAITLDAGGNIQKYSNGTLLWNDCVILYIEKVHVTQSDNTKNIFNMTSSDVTQVKPEGCDISNSTQSIKFSVVNDSTTADFTMSFEKRGSSWICKNISMSVAPIEEQIVPCASMQVPRDMAYSCQDQAFVYKYHNNKSLLITTIKFSGFQAEAFTNTTEQRFSQAYDCMGFFTIPIFMGLLTVGVLLTILFGGIMATMSISTMDRFDDPKGAGIQIGGSS